jgi:hypothetical protein
VALTVPKRAPTVFLQRGVEIARPLRSNARSGESTVAQPMAARFSNPLFAPLFGPIPVGGKSKD